MEIPSELIKFKDSLDGKTDNIRSVCSSLQNNVTALLNSTDTAKNGIDSNYESSNKAALLSSFSSISSSLNSINSSFGEVNAILSEIDSLIGEINALILLSQEIERLESELKSELESENSKNEKERNESRISELQGKISEKKQQFEKDKNAAIDKLSELKTKDIELDVSEVSSSISPVANVKVNGGTVVLKEFSYKGYKIPYYIYVPKVDGETKKLPVHMYLHGSGEMGNQILKVGLPKQLVEGTITPPGIVICPQTGKEEDYQDSIYQEALIELTKTITNEYNGDQNRVSISGHSYGANECYKLVKKLPGYFSAIVPYSCGEYISDKELEAFKGLKIWSLHGTKDTHPGLATFNADYEKTIKKLESAGVDVNFTPIEGVGHDVQDMVATEKYVDSEGNVINPIEWALMQTRA